MSQEQGRQSMQPRTPGFYWMREGDRRVPVEWTGKEWWGIAMQRPYSDDEVEDPVWAQPPSN